MGIETSYVCVGCGEECIEDTMGTAFIVAIRQPPGEDVQTLFACSISCFQNVLEQIQVDLTKAGECVECGAPDAPKTTGTAN